MMKHSTLLFAAVTIIIILALGGLLYYMYTYDPIMDGPRPDITERVAISQITFDSESPNILLVNVNVTAASFGNVTFEKAMLKKYPSGDVVAVLDLAPVTLSVGATKILSIDTGDKLTSGQYIVILITPRGGAFVSDQFTKP